MCFIENIFSVISFGILVRIKVESTSSRFWRQPTVNPWPHEDCYLPTLDCFSNFKKEGRYHFVRKLKTFYTFVRSLFNFEHKPNQCDLCLPFQDSAWNLLCEKGHFRQHPTDISKYHCSTGALDLPVVGVVCVIVTLPISIWWSRKSLFSTYGSYLRFICINVFW